MAWTELEGCGAMPDTTRQRVLAAALELFCEEGYAAGSLRAIADRVGITQAAVYYHFRAKDDLLDGLLTAPLDDLDARLDDAARRRGAEGVTDRRALLAALHDHARTWPDVVRLLDRDATLARHPTFRARRDAQRARCADLLAGAADGPGAVLAGAAAALLAAPVVAGRHEDPGDRELLLDAALRVLDTPRPRAHHAE
jgi:AcrR family transcriptional regulator